LKPGGLPVGIIWTYDGGYLIAGSDRGVAERAIATRNGGSPLIWSPEFLGQLPSSAGLHPSAFAWLNTKGALGILPALTSNPAIKGGAVIRFSWYSMERRNRSTRPAVLVSPG
jgi:hypothetical protein